MKTANLHEQNVLLKELTDIEKQLANGAFVRSRSAFRNVEETPTKHFFHVENHKQQSLIIKTLRKDSNSSPISSLKEIQILIEDHFRARWNDDNSDPGLNLPEHLSDIPVLDPAEEHPPCAGLIAKEEIQHAIQSLRTNTSPGSDGITPEFYQTFRNPLTPLLLQLYNNMYLRGASPPSQKNGIIKLIPKTGTRTDINNWRPISLLNCDYKILAKIIAKRLTPILESYISETQQAAINGRHVHNILLNIKAAIDHANDIAHPLAFLQIDFSKAFDRLSHDFILSVMQHIRIPAHLIKWTSILLRNNNARILVNHNLSETIAISTGIRQGCPLSMLLFTLATDVLSKKLTSLHCFKGFSLGRATMKLQQFADDTVLVVTDPNEVDPVLRVISDFSRHSNLKINPQKTVVMSNNKSLSQEIQKHLPEAKHTNQSRILGLLFSFDSRAEKENWAKAIVTIKNILDLHKNRSLSMLGKLLIIKTLVLPHITFTGRIFRCPVLTQKQISKVLHKFLWHPQVLEPIARSTLCKIQEHGGMGMVCAKTWTETAFLIKFKTLCQQQQSTLFWIRYGFYNIGYRLRNLYTSLYTPNKLQRPEPNDDWNYLVGVLRHKPITLDQWEEMSYKTLYLHLLNSSPAPLPEVNASVNPTSWSNVLLLRKPYKTLSNKEKEATYRVAHSGFF